MNCFGPVDLWRFYVTPGEGNPFCDQMFLAVPMNSTSSLSTYLFMFIATIALETVVYAPYLRSLRVTRIFWLIFVLNLATHPLVSFVFPSVVAGLAGNNANYIVVSEVFAPVVEGLLLAKLNKNALLPCLLVVITANLFSWWVGTLL